MTLFVFLFGILVGTVLNEKKTDEVFQLSQELQMKTLGVEVMYSILEGSVCEDADILSIADDLYEVSQRAEYMENLLGYDDPRIVDLKSYYFILEAKHWLLAKQRYEQCRRVMEPMHPLNQSAALFFYSNKGDCPRCDQQGTVLSYTKELYPGLMVYSFDINFESPVVDTLCRLYGVDSAPTVVVNGKVHEGYIDVDDLIAWSEREFGYVR